MVEILYTVFFCACHIISLILSLSLHRYSVPLLIGCCGCAILITVYAYKVYKRGEDSDDHQYYMTFEFNTKRTSIFIFLLLIATILYFLQSGYGSSTTGTESGAISSLFNLLDVKAIIWVYYFYGREYSDDKLFWPIIFLFCIYQVAAGWSGFIMYLAFYELYFWAKRHNKENDTLSVNAIIRTLLLCMVLISGAAAVYTVVFPFKNYLRGVTAGWNVTTFAEGYRNVTARISYFPSMFRSVIKYNEIVGFYNEQNDLWAETKSLFRPLVPGVLWGGKDKIITLGQAIPSAWFGYLRPNESDSISSLFHLGILFTISPLLGIVQTILFVIAFKITRGIYRRFERYPGQFKFLIFMTAMNFTRTANIETLFSQSTGHLIYLIAVMFFFGCIRINIYPDMFMKYKIRMFSIPSKESC